MNCRENLAVLTFWKADGGPGRLPLCCVTKSLKSKLKFHLKKNNKIITRIYFARITIYQDLYTLPGMSHRNFLKSKITNATSFVLFFSLLNSLSKRSELRQYPSASIFVDRYVLQVEALMPNHRPEKERATAPVTQLNP